MSKNIRSKSLFVALLFIIILSVIFLAACSAERIDTTETTVTEATETTPVTTVTEAPTEPPVIVVLDPGHDTELCPRDQPQLGVNEQDLNLKIALACRDRLEQYEGIKVILTRSDGSCPNAQEKYVDCVMSRTKVATENNADLFVSLHCNGTTGVLGAEANGAYVFISQHPDYHSESKKLGNLILDEICNNLDIRNGGVMTREEPEKGTYPDGTTKDFYYLISNNIDDGLPGIIIEHAFMDNSHDNEILRDDDNLTAFGIADADAIAKYYSLELKQ